MNKQRTEVHTESEFLEACGYVEEKIEYTLENIQVDCRELSKEQIKKMESVVVGMGEKMYPEEDCLTKSDTWIYFTEEFGYGWMITSCKNKHTITYEKFMELFSEKPIEELHAEHKESKREPKLGYVVKAWDKSDIYFTYGVFQEDDGTEHKPYRVSNNWFDNIELVTEININDFKK